MSKFPRYIKHRTGFVDCAFLHQISEDKCYVIEADGTQREIHRTDAEMQLRDNQWVVISEEEAERMLNT